MQKCECQDCSCANCSWEITSVFNEEDGVFNCPSCGSETDCEIIED